MEKLSNIHPGAILKEEFLEPMGISVHQLAKEIRTQPTCISQILAEKEGVTPSIALRLSVFFGNTPQFWLGLQNDYDLEEENQKLTDELNQIHPANLAPIHPPALTY